MTEIDRAKKVLADNGYAVECLWTVEDVQSRASCSDEEALKLMNYVMSTDGYVNDTWEHIELAIKKFDLKETETEEY